MLITDWSRFPPEFARQFSYISPESSYSVLGTHDVPLDISLASVFAIQLMLADLRISRPSSVGSIDVDYGNEEWSLLSEPAGNQCGCQVGSLLSGEKLVDNADLKQQLFDRFPNAIGGEMEGAGVAASAERRKCEWIVIKAICDRGEKNRISHMIPVSNRLITMQVTTGK